MRLSSLIVESTGKPTGKPTGEPNDEPTGEPNGEPMVGGGSSAKMFRRRLAAMGVNCLKLVLICSTK